MWSHLRRHATSAGRCLGLATRRAGVPASAGTALQQVPPDVSPQVPEELTAVCLEVACGCPPSFYCAPERHYGHCLWEYRESRSDRHSCAAAVWWGPARSPERRPHSFLRFWNAAAPPVQGMLLLKGTSSGAQPAPAAAGTSWCCLTTSTQRVGDTCGVWDGGAHATDMTAQAAGGLGTRQGGPACLSWELQCFSCVESGRDTVGHPSGTVAPCCLCSMGRT